MTSGVSCTREVVEDLFALRDARPASLACNVKVRMDALARREPSWLAIEDICGLTIGIGVQDAGEEPSCGRLPCEHR